MTDAMAVKVNTGLEIQGVEPVLSQESENVRSLQPATTSIM